MNGKILHRLKELEEENESLRNEVEQLHAELLERDELITSLEAQVKVLIMEDESSHEPRKASALPCPRLGLPPRCPTKEEANRPRARQASAVNDDSASPPKPLTPRKPSLVPPSRTTTATSPPQTEYKSFVDTPDDDSGKLNPADARPTSSVSIETFDETQTTDASFASGSKSSHETSETSESEDRIKRVIDTKKDPIKDARPTSSVSIETFDETQSVDASYTSGSKSSHETNETSESEDRIKRVIDTKKGPIKALPRELSIFNSDDDDVTKYSCCDELTYHVEAGEMRDAYNARGIYSGSVSRRDEVPHGMGTMKYHLQGRSYEGHWFYGHWHGLGKIVNPNGDIYVGLVVKDLREGRGKLYYADGRVFEGTFEQDDPVKGTLIFPDGSRYVGELHNGCRHGRGTYYFTDGSMYQGQTVMNVFEGKGKMTWTDGGWYDGEWLRGEIHGYGTEVRPDGSVRHKGQWNKGVPIRI